jgi:hypothetical protein
VSAWTKTCKLVHTFLWEYSDKRLKSARILGQLGVFLTFVTIPTTPTTEPKACAKTTTRLCATSPITVA